MGHTLSLDAGGSKCAALLYDESFTLLAAAQTGGVNTTQNTPELSRKNMRDCIASLKAQSGMCEVERAYVSVVGPLDVLKEVTREYMAVGEWIVMSEPEAGLWAGLMRQDGILALAGTGSDVFWIVEQAPKNRRLVVGGWGPILGDQGSGTWIGFEALRAAVAASEGWGERTVIMELLREAWGLDNDYDLVRAVHSAPSPFGKVAQASRIVGQACELGDAVALSITRGAGFEMARQTICLIEREGAQGEIVCCGGAWKTHISMYESFRAHMTEYDPALKVSKPCFEHVMAGAVRRALEKMPREDARKLLSEKLSQYVITW